MQKLLIISSFLLAIGFNGYSFEKNDIAPTDTSYLYEFDLKYVGSNSAIDPNYRYVLEHLVESLIKDTSLTIHVRGHVCCGPSFRLSKRRARKVYKFLKRSGIHKSRITYKGYSDTAPLAFPEKTEEDEIRNRRVDFILCKPNSK